MSLPRAQPLVHKLRQRAAVAKIAILMPALRTLRRNSAPSADFDRRLQADFLAIAGDEPRASLSAEATRRPCYGVAEVGMSEMSNLTWL